MTERHEIPPLPEAEVLSSTDPHGKPVQFAIRDVPWLDGHVVNELVHLVGSEHGFKCTFAHLKCRECGTNSTVSGPDAHMVAWKSLSRSTVHDSCAEELGRRTVRDVMMK